MSRPEPAEERRAREIISHVLGVQIERHDDGSASAMFDFSFALDSELGACEMTMLVDPKAMALFALMDDLRPIHSAKHSWLLALRPGHDLRAVGRHAQVALPLLEAHGVTSLNPYEFWTTQGLAAPFNDASVRWLIEQRIDADVAGTPGSGIGGFWIAVHGGGGAMEPHIDALTRWVADAYRSGRFEAELTKLDVAGRVHRHLFVVVGDLVPMATRWPLDAGDTMPTGIAIDDDRVTGLWLHGTRSGLLWTRGEGWRRYESPPAER